MFSVILFFILLIKELLGISQALAELSRLDPSAVSIPSDCQTGGVGRPSCQTPVLLLFNSELSLVLSFLGVGEGEEIRF